ncbi:MAG: DUF4065 domain-containing protein [Candidatus Kaiserbacteria bacterium]|nr:DUF4065 domain-containing protein [Candidatus Kaiserbacteria bacterium]
MGTQRKTVTALDVGRYLIYRAGAEKKPLTNKKLQKLVYYSQAWSLVLNGKKLFNDPIEAWVHGPAVRSLYLRYKRYGFDPIDEVVDEKSISIPPKGKHVIDEVWDVYGSFDAAYLEFLTHSEKPWQDARNGLNEHEISDREIPRRDMKAFYTAKMEGLAVK